MKVVTLDDHTIDFDASHSLVLMDICEGVPHLPIHSAILMKIQNGDLDETWETLTLMLHAADFLNMPHMLDRLGERMADMLKGKPVEQVREMMSLVI